MYKKRPYNGNCEGPPICAACTLPSHNFVPDTDRCARLETMNTPHWTHAGRRWPVLCNKARSWFDPMVLGMSRAEKFAFIIKEKWETIEYNEVLEGNIVLDEAEVRMISELLITPGCIVSYVSILTSKADVPSLLPPCDEWTGVVRLGEKWPSIRALG